MLVCTWCAVGLLMRACCHRLFESCPAHLCMSPSVLLSSSGPSRPRARNAACESPPVTAVTCRGASTRMLHRATLHVGLLLMLRKPKMHPGTSQYIRRSSSSPPHPPACPLQRPLSVCALSRTRDWGLRCRLICCIQLRVRTSTPAVACVPTCVASHATTTCDPHGEPWCRWRGRQREL